MTFINEMQKISSDLELRGVNCLIPAPEEMGLSLEELDSSEFGAVKAEYIRDHLEKIEASESILVANYPKNGIEGYIGPNSLIEIAFAYALKKGIYLMFELGEQSCKSEVLGMEPLIINGNIENV